MFKAPLLVVLLSALLASASPVVPTHQKVPQGTKMLAIDPNTNQMKAFGHDGKLIGYVSHKGAPASQGPAGSHGASGSTPASGSKGTSGSTGPHGGSGSTSKPKSHVKRAASNCTPLSVDDLRKLPGWKALSDAAAKNWGTGSYNLVTNPSDYPDSPATVCVSDNNPPVQLTGQPKCTTSAAQSDGKLVGTDGTVSLTQTDGTDAKTSLTVTKESSISVGVTFGVSFGIPGIGDANVGTSITTDFKNSLATNTESTVSTSKSHQITMNAPAGKTCHLEYTSKTCDQTGTGSINYIASGWAWFNYNDRTHDHYKWALSIDGTLTNVKDRTSTMEFSSRLHSVTSTNYNGKCA